MASFPDHNLPFSKAYAVWSAAKADLKNILPSELHALALDSTNLLCATNSTYTLTSTSALSNTFITDFYAHLILQHIQRHTPIPNTLIIRTSNLTNPTHLNP